MTVLAENRFTITKALFLEGMAGVSRESYGKFAWKAVAVLALAWLVLLGITLWRGQSPVLAGIELIVLCLAALWVLVLLPRQKGKRAFAALQQRGSGLDRVTRFYEDHLEVDASGAQTQVPYGEIRRIVETRHLLLLVTDGNTGILLKRDGFQAGSAATVRQLLARGSQPGAAR